MRIGQSRPRALATSLAGLLTLGIKVWRLPDVSVAHVRPEPITAAGAVEVFHLIPIFTSVYFAVRQNAL